MRSCCLARPPCPQGRRIIASDTTTNHKHSHTPLDFKLTHAQQDTGEDCAGDGGDGGATNVLLGQVQSVTAGEGREGSRGMGLVGEGHGQMHGAHTSPTHTTQ